MIEWQCAVTGNPAGTDTEMIGHPCQCDGCRAYREISRLTAEVGRLRTVIRVNMLRMDPTLSHDEIDKVLGS